MPTRFRAAAVAALASVASLLILPIAFAQETVAPPAPKKAKPAKAASASAAAKKDRRPGELEGWESGVTAPVKKTSSNRPADAIGEKTLPDGGLPLPEARGGGAAGAPVGFDSKGNMGGMFKF